MSAMTFEATMTYEATASGARAAKPTKPKESGFLDLAPEDDGERGTGGAPRADHYSERDQAQVVREEGRAPCCLRIGVV